MIKVNGKIIEQGSFPDGTLLLRPRFNNLLSTVSIEWNYESDAEIFTLICIVKRIRELQSPELILTLPYIPHARMDRVKNKEDVFTLKYFAEIINSLSFEKVYVLDAHSNVALALIDRVREVSAETYISTAISRVEEQEDNCCQFFFPDEGAMKRYSEGTSRQYSFGIKKRDWVTGNILGLELMGNLDINKPVLIVDDICSRGGTFFHSALALKEKGVKNIYLYITHCEKTILDGELIKSGLIKKIYTTSSICNFKHELIEVFDF